MSGAAPVPTSKRAAVERELLREIEESLREMDRTIQGLYRGPFAGLVSGLGRALFSAIGREGVRRRAIALQRAVLACASEPARSCQADLEKNFEAYLENHEAWVRADRSHPKATALRKMVWEEFQAQVEMAFKILHSPGSTYEEMVRNAFPECRTAEEALRKHFRAAEKLLELAEREKGLFRVPPLVRGQVFHVSRRVYAGTLRRVVSRCGEIYRRARDS